jgi:hypothetical protein
MSGSFASIGHSFASIGHSFASIGRSFVSISRSFASIVRSFASIGVSDSRLAPVYGWNWVNRLNRGTVGENPSAKGRLPEVKGRPPEVKGRPPEIYFLTKIPTRYYLIFSFGLRLTYWQHYITIFTMKLFNVPLFYVSLMYYRMKAQIKVN